MQAWLVKPGNEYLKNIADCYWYVKDDPEGLMILPPAVSNDIILNLIPPTTIFSGDERFFLNGNYFSGVRTKLFNIDQHGSFELYGLRFKPWIMTHNFNIEPRTHLNRFSLIDADTQLLVPFNELKKRLTPGLSKPAAVELFDDFLMEIFAQQDELHKTFLKIFSASNPDTKTSVNELAAATGLSVSTIERLFKKYTGITPAALFRILGYNEVWNALNDPGNKTWTDIVYQCGFFDQAHFIKEFRKLTGMSPGSYMKQRNSTLDRYRLF